MDKRKEYLKNYYQAHKHSLLDKMTEKVFCKYCNVDISRGNMTKHVATPKHLRNLENYVTADQICTCKCGQCHSQKIATNSIEDD